VPRPAVSRPAPAAVQPVAAPPVYRPFVAASQLKPAAAPPVYSPAAQGSQQRNAPIPVSRSGAPPVYRPPAAASQLKPSGGPQMKLGRGAPPVYRPQPAATQAKRAPASALPAALRCASPAVIQPMEEDWDSDSFVLPDFPVATTTVPVEEAETGGGGHNVGVSQVVATVIAPSEAIKNKIAQALNDAGFNELGVAFASQYKHGQNPAISVDLMVSLQEKGFLKIEKSKQTGGKVGCQNSVQYHFLIVIGGHPPKAYKVGEWHLHWGSGNSLGSPGWKTGKFGGKTESTDHENMALKKLLGTAWGKV
jgi:hypothetical protein